MKKQSKHFTCFLDKEQQVTIQCVGYFWPGEDIDTQFDYDVDEIWYEGANILPVINLLHGSAKEIDMIHSVCMTGCRDAFKSNDDLFARMGRVVNPIHQAKTA